MTAVAAASMGRRYAGIDISQKYVAETRKRIAETLAGKIRKTDIAENPELLRAARAHKPATRRTPRGQADQPVLFS